ncbi:hypothetical protein FKP32DRAFT_1675308 [Trametes sanguinea]|nr:hypothetical protein FKP32DRAFT_1675308 [Trametes sanguinea]
MSAAQERPTTDIPLEANQANSSAGTERPAATGAFQPAPPTETTPATQVTTPPQQAATAPGAGGVQHVVVESNKPSFTQQVVGYAKEIRGTVLRKPETKDYGGKIRKGEEPWPPPADNQGTDSSANDTKAA